VQVELVLKQWEVVEDPKTKQPKVAGTYGVVMAGNEIAEQEFNAVGYSQKSKDIHFGPEVVAAAASLDSLLKKELVRLLAEKGSS
jgi:hypothetical protein